MSTNKLETLIEELNKNRKESYDILDRITNFRNKIDTVLPTSSDFKYRKLLEDKMRLVTDIIKTELDVRKSIDNSIKMEADLSRKLEEDYNEESGYNITNADIRKIIEEVKEG